MGKQKKVVPPLPPWALESAWAGEAEKWKIFVLNQVQSYMGLDISMTEMRLFYD